MGSKKDKKKKKRQHESDDDDDNAIDDIFGAVGSCSDDDVSGKKSHKDTKAKKSKKKRARSSSHSSSDGETNASEKGTASNRKKVETKQPKKVGTAGSDSSDSDGGWCAGRASADEDSDDDDGATETKAVKPTKKRSATETTCKAVNIVDALLPSANTKGAKRSRTAAAAAFFQEALSTTVEGGGDSDLKKEKKKKKKKEKDQKKKESKWDGNADGNDDRDVAEEACGGHHPKEGKKEKKERKEKKQSGGDAGGESDKDCEQRCTTLPPHQLVLAPMVNASELAFRLLARRHGAQLCYTPMMHADKFVADANYRKTELQTMPSDMPLVGHFCSNDPETFLAAAKLAEPHCVAIDLNLGCPQRSAHAGHFGSFCRKPGSKSDAMDLDLVVDIVATAARGLKIPLFVKTRLLDDVDETVKFCKRLEAAGCALLAVHGRYRGSPSHPRDGPAHLHHVATIKAALKIPVLTNGNVTNAEDLLAALELTHADGVMSAEGALDNPAIFGQAAALAKKRREAAKAEVREVKSLRKESKRGERTLTTKEKNRVDDLPKLKEKLRSIPKFENVDHLPAVDGVGNQWATGPVDLAEQYLQLAKRHRPTLKCLVYHLRRLCGHQFTRYQLRDTLEHLALDVRESVRDKFITDERLKLANALVKKLRDYVDGKVAPPSPPAAPVPSPAVTKEALSAQATKAQQAVASAAARAKAQAAALARDPAKVSAAATACAQKRSEFVVRMRKKAKREGKDDEDFYVKQGRAPPTIAEVAHVKGLQGNERMVYWREHFGQHCIMYHVDGRCDVSMTWGCGFLHEEATR